MKFCIIAAMRNFQNNLLHNQVLISMEFVCLLRLVPIKAN